MSHRVRQETFIAQLHDGTFDAVNYEALRTQGSYLTQYTDQLTAAFLMEGREAIWSSVSGTAEHGIYHREAAIGSACCLQARCWYYARRPAAAGAADEPRCTPRRGWREYDIEDSALCTLGRSGSPTCSTISPPDCADDSRTGERSTLENSRQQ